MIHNIRLLENEFGMIDTGFNDFIYTLRIHTPP